MNQTCKQCSADFEITQSDLDFYEKVSPVFNGKKELIPAPTRCPDCRQQRRMGWRNDRTLHHRKSDLTGKQIISMYSADKPYKVYDQDEWWSDKWDAMEYARDFDFSRTFAEQFAELGLDVPHISLFTTNADNSYFTNHTLNLKNCYLIAGGGDCEDCMYGRFFVRSKNCIDGSTVYSCELCYEVNSCEKCYGCMFLTFCRNCTDCIMIEDCQSCSNCIGCFGLRNKEYCIFNEYVGKEAYEARLEELRPLTWENIALLRKGLDNLRSRLPHPQSHLYGCEDSSGDMLTNSHNAQYCFDSSDCENCKHIHYTPHCVESQDVVFTAPDGVEFCYDVGSTVGARNCMACFLVWYGDNIFYSTECHRSSHLFGCIGLRNKQCCIFNKQYTQEEYEQLVPKIINHMRTTGEWGEYLPLSIARFGYNESVAQEFFPITQEQALANGWKWHNDSPTEQSYLGPTQTIPNTIDEVAADITTHILRCEVTGKPYKIIPQELQFYQQMGIPVPLKCPDQRYKERMALRNPRHLWTRPCTKCSKEIQTTYSPDRPEIVYCETCYLAEVY